MSSYHLKANNEAPLVEPEGKTWTLKEMQDFVGGYARVHAAPNHPGWVLVVNEDGKLKDLPFNKNATDLYQYEPIVGDVLLTMAELIE